MKLHEAILRGSVMRPQGFDYTFYEGKSCALGAAFEGAGHNFTDCFLPSEAIRILYIDYSLMIHIIRRNDSLRQTREEIAAWIQQEYPDVEVPTGPNLIPLEEVIEPVVEKELVKV